ncbi:MAG: glycosyltransferase family 39 protein [Formivibrio sp.]|nr:glycosyltransferase family 39 protein [Formivibrio sp.]
MVCSTIPDGQAIDVKERRFVVASLPPLAIVFLLLTTAVSLVWSRYTLLTTDEFLVLWTDSVPSIGQVFDIQRTYPISLDPLVYHAIAHTAIRIFGANAFAIRLPSLFGVLLMQICLFIFVRRVASEQAAIFALAFPVLACALQCSMVGRPYGLMLGLFSLAMVSWQTATRRKTKRTIALVTLTLVIALALNTHYYGVLILVPLYSAELYRSLRRRRFDLPVVASMSAGTAAILFVLPFMGAAAEFRNHYYSGFDRLKPYAIVRAYAWVLSNHPAIQPASGFSLSVFANLSIFAVVVVVIGVSFFACLRQLREKDLQIPEAELVFLIALAALPFFGYPLARFTSHSLEPHYCFGLIVGMSALVAVGLFSQFKSDHAGRIILVALFVMIVATGVGHILVERSVAHERLSTLILTPDTKTALTAVQDKRLYFQNNYAFAFASYYEPDPDVRSRMVLVYSKDQELRWKSIDTTYLTAIHMRNFTQFTILPYEALTMQTGDHVFVDVDADLDWMAQALTAIHAEVRPIGPAFEGKVLLVHFPQ